MDPKVNQVDRDSLIKDLSSVSDNLKDLFIRSKSSKHIHVQDGPSDLEITDEANKEDDEFPCYDIVSPENPDAMRILKCCIAKRLHDECAKALIGPWIDPNNVDIVRIGGGLSNYLFCAYLKPTCDAPEQTPRKVLVRIYGEVLRNNADWVILESIIFALLSEKKLGPKLHSLFPGGRIEQYIESRPLRTNELPLPSVSAYIARKLASLHRLQMPLVKKPDYIIKTLGRYLSQLKDSDKTLKRPTSWSSIPATADSSYHEKSSTMNGDCQDIPVKHDPRSQKPEPSAENDQQKRRNRSVSTIVPNPLLAQCELCSEQQQKSGEECEESPERTCSDEKLRKQVSRILRSYDVFAEFHWLKTRLTEKYADKFPVTFCHNDVQENNILVVPDPSEKGKINLLPIDFEYCSYNFRGFDIGNHFNEWCHEYSCDQNGNGFITKVENYPTEQQQLHFIKHYLNALYSAKEDGGESLFYEPQSDDQFESPEFAMPVNLGALRGMRLSQSKQGPCLVEEKISWDSLPLTQWEKNPRNMLLEAYYGALTSNLFWGVWSLIQTLISNIEFNFIDYAEVRLRLYHQMKRAHLEMERHLEEEVKGQN